MNLILPDFGLVFWTGLVFCILLFILTKFIWKPILKAVNEREAKIADSLALAEQTKLEMKALHAQNENMLKEARAERDAMIREANDTATKMLEKAKADAKLVSEKELQNARNVINAEKAAAISELKSQVASLSIEIAEKIVRGELSSDDKQKTLASKLAEDISLN